MSKKLAKAVGAMILTGGLVFAGQAAANATTEYPSGGTWHHGVSSGTAYSNFYHSKLHRSTAQNTAGKQAIAEGNKNAWSNASIATKGGNNKAFYFIY